MPLPYHLSWASHAIPLIMIICQRFFVGLKGQPFPLFFSHQRHWMSVVYLLSFYYADELEITEVDMNSVGVLSRVLFNPHLVATL